MCAASRLRRVWIRALFLRRIKAIAVARQWRHFRQDGGGCAIVWCASNEVCHLSPLPVCRGVKIWALTTPACILDATRAWTRRAIFFFVWIKQKEEKLKAPGAMLCNRARAKKFYVNHLCIVLYKSQCLLNVNMHWNFFTFVIFM